MHDRNRCKWLCVSAVHLWSDHPRCMLIPGVNRARERQVQREGQADSLSLFSMFQKVQSGVIRWTDRKTDGQPISPLHVPEGSVWSSKTYRWPLCRFCRSVVRVSVSRYNETNTQSHWWRKTARGQRSHRPENAPGSSYLTKRQTGHSEKTGDDATVWNG